MPIEPAIVAEARRCFDEARGSHDWSHTERVLALCEHIGAHEEADMDVLRLAAVLHDIGRKDEDDAAGGICHAERGAERARLILEEHDVAPDMVDSVVHCIEAHRFRNDREPETLEAQILFDADKLDSIGAVGVGRAFLFAGEVGAVLHNPEKDVAETEAYSREDSAYREYMVKLKHVQDRILTSEGKRMAAERHDYMVAFFERLDREAQGEV